MEKPIARDSDGKPIRVGDVVSPGWPPDRFYRVVSACARYGRGRIYLNVVMIGTGEHHGAYNVGDTLIKRARSLILRRDDFIDEGL